MDSAVYLMSGDVVDDLFGQGAPAPADGADGSAPDRGASATATTDWWLDGLDESELRRALLTLPSIEQAKGVLMGHYGIDADHAFAVLCRWSSSRGTTVRDVCATLLDRVVGHPRPDLADGLQSLLDGDAGAA